MKLEVKEDDSAYVFTFTKYENDLESNISTATVSVNNPSGTEYIASTSMTISGAAVTHTVDFSTDPSAGTWVIGRNYQVIFVIDGETHLRLFDIVKYPFINEVTISNLRKENRQALDDIGYKKNGDADSGSATTVIDGTLIGEDTFIGGEIEVYPLDNSQRSSFHTITAFDDTTGTITFTPTRFTGVSSESYTIRRSFSDDIQRAGELVQSALWKKDMRAHLILDNTQINNMVVYKFFEKIYARRRTSLSEDDRDNVQYNYYLSLFQTEYEGLPLAYDLDEDGIIDTDERKYTQTLRLQR